MKLFSIGKDGGPESTVTGFWLAEIKSLFSAALLRFSDGSRESYHSHAFDSVSWVLKGELREEHLNGKVEYHSPSLAPVITRRETWHRVFSNGDTWVFTLRGPWARMWGEYNPKTKTASVLTDNRKVMLEAKL